ncbi:MAG TPA: NADPH:quinone oxidoreductase family protein [Moraxellaceae bacterium]|nr:NADPH:quinone oxidoreductase family protein [Moraxellaceae bacterium]
MKAVLCKQHGLPETLVVEDVPSPVPGAGQVLVSVKACGVNFPDTLIIQNLYQFKPPLPFSPGGELSGIVKAVGEGVKQLQVGQPVLAFTGWGGFAEEVVAQAKQVVPLPPGLDMAVAAAFMMTYGTSFHALKDRAQLQAGETLLVLGAAGGVGLAAIELGKKMGARVIAAASSAEKLEVCRQHGADMLVNYEQEDLRERIKALTEGKGVDVVYDPVGGAHTEPALRSMAWKGRYLVVGFAAGDIPKIPLNLPLLKGCAIMGVFWGDFAAREPQANLANGMQLFQWLLQGELKPHISQRFPLEKAGEALRALMERKVTGKIVLVP